MAFQSLYSILNCAISKSNDDHISEEPIMLSCGHPICAKCRPNGMNIQKIECKTCKKANKSRNVNNASTDTFETILNDHLIELFKMISENYYEKMHFFENLGENIHEKIKYFKDTVDLRIESLKGDLDTLCEYFHQRLDKIESIIQDDIELKGNNTKEFENDFENLRESIKNKQNLTKENFYNHQKSLRNLNKMINECKKTTPNIELQISESKLDTKLIGNIVIDIEDESECLNNIVDRMKENKFDKICMSKQEGVSDFIFLSNGNLLLVDSPNDTPTTLSIYDSQFRLIKSVTTIGEQTEICVYGIEFNNKDEIYMSDCSHNFIIKTDLELNHLVTRNNESDNFDCPIGIAYKNGSIYVCNYNKTTIVKLNSKSLNVESTFTLTHYPWHIKIIGNTACVRDRSFRAIYFYNINNEFSVIRKYDGHSGLLGASDSYFFEYAIFFGTFYCYDKDGNVKKTIEAKYIKDCWNFKNQPFLNGTISLHKSKLYFSCNLSNKLVLSQFMIGTDDDIAWNDNYKNV